MGEARSGGGGGGGRAARGEKGRGRLGGGAHLWSVCMGTFHNPTIKVILKKKYPDPAILIPKNL